MMNNALKRVLSLTLALMMVISLVPGFGITAFAAEDDQTDTTSETTEATEATTATEGEEYPIMPLADGDPTLDTLVTGLGATYTEASATRAGTVSWTAEADAASGAVTINGSVVGFSPNGKAYAAEKTQLTLTNNLGVEAVLTFDYEITIAVANKDTASIAGVSYSAGTGAYEKTMAAGESIVIALGAALRAGAANGASIKMTNVRLGANPVIETNFLAAQNGSYSVSYKETIQEITEDTKISNTATTNYTLTATPAEGYSFAGWYNQTKGIYIGAGATSNNVRFDEPCDIVPLFIKTEEAVYGVGDARFADLADAATYANNASDKVIVLLKDATLAAGDYTIPAGITLLIPFDAANTLYTDKPGCTSSANNNVAWVTPYAYRTLTMADGAKLNVKGTISVGSMHAAGGAQTAGSPTGAYGHIAMNSGSNITVENGGKLYAWGYITGSGTITANSGAKVYENLQVTDFRGGSASATLVPTGDDDPMLDKKKVFPFSQYYVQNIEVALTLYAGATESVYTSIYALDDVNSVMIDFIGTTTSMFYIGEGSYVVKDYDPASDRLNISAGGTGKVEVNGLSLTMAGVTVSSSMFNLPITSNITINVNGGSATINQDAALMPGSQVNIAQGAALTVAGGYNVFVYDATEWALGNFVHDNVKVRPVSYSPSGKGSRSVDVDAKVDVNGTLYIDGYLYTTESGANITSSNGTGMIWLNAGAGDRTYTNQVTQSGTDTTFVDIPITSAKLMNADGTFTETASAAEGYGYGWSKEEGKWLDYVTVSFDGNGAENETASQTVTYETIYWAILLEDPTMAAITLPDAPTKVGSDFLGWNTAKDGSGTNYEAGAAFAVTENVTLYAQWEAEKFTLSFVDEDGNTVLESVEVEYGASYTLPAVPEKTGYEGFWDVEGIGAVTEITSVVADMEFVAAYNAIYYDLLFDGNGGYFNSEPEWTVVGTEGAYEYGYVIDDHGTPERKGYEFTGWNTEADGSGTSPVFGVTTLTGDTTYYAQWKIETYTITWNNEDGSLITTTEVDYNTVPTPPADPEKAADAEYTYIFAGWTPEIVAATEDTAYTATYSKTAKRYDVTFTIDGEEYKVVSYQFGSAVTAPEYTAPEGYTFSGWDVPDTMPAEDITLDATLTAKTYTVAVYTVATEDEYAYEIALSKETAAYGADFTTTLSAEVGTGMVVEAVWVNNEEVEFTFANGTLTIAAADVTGNIDIYAYATVSQTMDINGGAISEDYREMLTEQGAVIDGDKITMAVHYGMTGTIDALDDDITKTGHTFNGYTDENGKTYAIGDTLVTDRDITLTINWKVNEHTVTWVIDGETTTETVAYGTALTAPADPEKEGHTFIGWEGTIPATMPDEDITITLTSTWEKKSYTVTWVDENGETVDTESVAYGEAATKTPTVPAKEGYTGQWETTATNVTGDVTIKPVYTIKAYTITWVVDGVESTATVDHGTVPTYEGTPEKAADENFTYTFKAWDQEVVAATADATYTAVFVKTGWLTDDNGTTYIVEDEIAYKGTVAHVDGDAYNFDANGYIVAGAGLVRHVTEDGTVEYYYFEDESYTALKSTSKWIENVNDLLPVWEYTFDDRGVIEHHEDTTLNGIVEQDGEKYYFIDGVKAYMGLIEIDGEYYYVRSNGKLAVDCDYWISKTNGLLEERSYQFDAEGKLIKSSIPEKNGIYAEDGSLYYYENGARTYAGLIQIDGEYYYAKTNAEVVHGGIFYITKTNGLMKQGNYNFDETGKMIPMPEEEPGFTGIQDGYYYKDGVKYYAGLIQIDGYYYYVNSSCKVITGQTYWISKTNDLLPEKAYTFDAEGKMVIGDHPDVKTGLYEENGTLYYYEEGVKTYAGLIEIDGYYYYIKSDCSAVKDGTFYVTKNNGVMKSGWYTFDAQGRMVTE